MAQPPHEWFLKAARMNILEVHLSKMPWKRFDLREFARRLPGASAAKLRAVVDQAASYALAENRRIEAEDLHRALNGNAIRIVHGSIVWNGMR